MKICHYFVVESTKVGGGIITSAKQQRKALDQAGIEWTEDPTEDYDILHLNTLSPFSLYRMLEAKFKGRKVLFHAHTTVKDFKGSFKFSRITSPLYNLLTKTVYSRSDILIAPSEYAKDLLKEKGVETDIRVITNGFDKQKLEGFQKKQGEVDEKYNLDGFTVVNLAGVFRRKGVKDFVYAAERLEDVEFIWFGKIPSLSPREIKKEIEAAPENLKFTGFVEDPREAFAAGDLFFFPTHEETQGMSVLEAAYCEMPILVRDIPAFEGWLENRENCLKADSSEDFVQKIEEVRDDKELRAKIARGAKKESKKHTLDRVGEKLRDAYKSML